MMELWAKVCNAHKNGSPHPEPLVERIKRKVPALHWYLDHGTRGFY